MSDQKTSLSKRLIVYLILFSSAIALVATAIQLYSEYNRDITRLSTLVSEINTIHQEGLTQAVWATDMDGAGLILSGISDLPDIAYAEIVDKGKILANSESTDHSLSPQDIEAIKNNTDNFISSKTPLTYNHRNQELVIGELHLYATLENVYQLLYSRIGLILVTNGIKTALVALFFYLMFARLVSRHLEKVSRYLGQHGNRLPSSLLLLDRKPSPGNDELDLLVHSINSMYENLVSSVDSLHESEERVRLLLDSTGEAIYGIDLNGDCTFANPACARLTGFDSVDEFLGLDIHQTIHHTRSDGSLYPPEECRIYQAHIKGLEVHVDDEVFWRKDGASFPVEYWAHPIYHDGNIIGSVVTFNDITERRQNEAELDEHRHHLEQLVDARTRELREAQDELVRQERLATLGQLTATVSHELRNPLGAMRPSLYLIKKRLGAQADEKMLQACDRIDRNIDRCDHIIDELLDFTRITKLVKQATPIDKWLESVIDEQHIPQGIQVYRNYSLQDFELPIDAERLRRAIINVVENACQAMLDESGKTMKGSRMSIKTDARDDRIEIAIADTGTGITEEVMVKIFEPLFSTKNFGVGLGMPTVKQIMERHGGGLEVESEPGKGTTVTLWLPISTGTDQRENQPRFESVRRSGT